MTIGECPYWVPECAQEWDTVKEPFGMRIAFFDCSYGAAGDMILGALVDAGVPFTQLKKALEEGLGVHGLKITRKSVTRCGVTGTKVLVGVEHEHDHHRHLSQILTIIDRAKFPKTVKDRASAAFRKLAEAEAKVHRSTPEEIHFHEVGCLDAIADIAGAMLCMEWLGIERVAVSPLTLGSGTARCAHGVIPVPAPATVELLAGVPTVGGPFQMEMTTPTAAVVLTVLAEAFGPQPLMQVEKVGYGAGTREIEGHANFLRVTIGEAGATPHLPDTPQFSADPLHWSRLSLFMTEIDDMNPELLGDLLGKLFEAGCLDAHFTPIQMKKNRPAIQIQVLCEPDRARTFMEILFQETSTFGVKVLNVDRFCLQRHQETMETKMGPLDIKIGMWGDAILKVTPEYESCRVLARKNNLPLAVVYRRAQAEIDAHCFPQSEPAKQTSRKKKR
jgi:uncharacterized protein (TIGR00299 family) protein